jgi:hypothetical protein
VSTGQIAQQVGANHGWSHSTQEYLEQLLASHSVTVLSWEGEIAAYVAGFAQKHSWLLLIPILSIFFLNHGEKFASDWVTI